MFFHLKYFFREFKFSTPAVISLANHDCGCFLSSSVERQDLDYVISDFHVRCIIIDGISENPHVMWFLLFGTAFSL